MAYGQTALVKYIRTPARDDTPAGRVGQDIAQGNFQLGQPAAQHVSGLAGFRRRAFAQLVIVLGEPRSSFVGALAPGLATDGPKVRRAVVAAEKAKW